jgi:gluconate 5-dehydrogenase
MSSLDLFSLAGKTALITGSSRGIGLALARGAASAGAAVILNGRDGAHLQTVAAEMRASGATVHALVFDVTDHAACRQAIDGFEATNGPIDILVNNAGMQHRAPLEDFPIEAFEKLLATNITSVFNAGQAVARHMIARGRGKIVNISSLQAALARPTIAPYTATKGAVSNLTKGMAADWGPKGLQCNAIAPGYFKTVLNQALIDNPEFNAWVCKRTPAGRWGDTAELVGAFIFLASDASSYVNGITLFVDGGLTSTV